MAVVWTWVEANWFSLLQGAGIILGLLFTGISSSREARSRRTGNILTLTQLHRDLWNEVHRRADLQRVVQEQADLVGHPITAAEEEFMNLVIVHFQTGWQMAVQRSGISIEVLRKDVRSFFVRPVPRAVWEKTKGERDARFVGFIEGCLAK